MSRDIEIDMSSPCDPKSNVRNEAKSLLEYSLQHGQRAVNQDTVISTVFTSVGILHSLRGRIAGEKRQVNARGFFSSEKITNYLCLE